MSLFKKILEEKRRPNAGPSKDAIEAARQKLSQQFAAQSSRRPTPLLNTDIVDVARTKGGSAAVPKSAPEMGVWLGSDDQAIKDAREALRKQKQRRSSKSVEAASDVDVQSRTQAANTSARARETRPAQKIKLGDTTKGGPVKVTVLKPSKPAPAPKPEAIKQSAVSAKQAAYRKRVATKGSDLLKSIQGGRETTARMSRAYGKNLAATADDIIKGISAERKPKTLLSPSGTKPSIKTPKVDLPSTYTPPKVDKGPSINVAEPKPVVKDLPSTYTPPKVDKGPSINVAEPKPVVNNVKNPTVTPAQQKRILARTQQVKASTLTSAKPQLGPRLSQKVLKQTATATKAVKPGGLRAGLGGVASVAGAGFDIMQGREDAKKAGAGDTRAWLRGIVRAGGGLLGGTAGAIGGGGIGSAALGIGGYMAGSAAADKLFTSIAGATAKQREWMKQANLSSQKGTRADEVRIKKGNQAVIYDPRVGKERIGTLDPTTNTYKAGNLDAAKAYTSKNWFERLGRQFSRSNEGTGLFGMNIVKGHGLADMAKRYYAQKDESERAQRVANFKRTAVTK